MTTTGPSVATTDRRRGGPVRRGGREVALSKVLRTRTADETLSLAPEGSGWQLRNGSGRVVYSAEGPDAHRQCLRRAYEHGVLYLS